ncbi:NADPH-dependent FMN reductase [Portibacter marinus]|uniref:NADPH-dependent FMN reductase n=1 Tax=Portibacter marinus TaxID=2898660 RepID=UPI001F280C8F|nr:NAD(P)H-dependent oxidoreductase [Portibacter marinus]
MITVIAGTNRQGSRTKQVAERYFELISSMTDEECKFLALEDLSENFIHSMMYEEDNQNKDIAEKQDEYFTPAHKLVFVVPEYNGSFPGIFKMFIDAISIRNYKENFQGKKVALIGVASGRGGNLRGMDHLTTSLNYLKMNIYPNRLPIALIEKVMDKKGQFTNELIKLELQKHAEGFLLF